MLHAVSPVPGVIHEADVDVKVVDSAMRPRLGRWQGPGRARLVFRLVLGSFSNLTGLVLGCIEANFCK